MMRTAKATDALRRESAFYRHVLKQIASAKRRTLEKRLAESALAFWDQMQRRKN